MGKRNRSSGEEKSKKRSKKTKVQISTEPPQEKATLAPPAPKEKEKDDAKKLEKRRKTIFLKKKIDVEISLLPGSLHNTEDAVQNSLNQLLMKYSDGLGGIMLAFENLNFKMDGDGLGKGWVLNELPWIHYTVSCDALVFRPFAGCQLDGVVNECFPSHIGILVMKYFNAMVAAEHLVGAGYTFDADVQKWVSEDGGQTMCTNSKISFEVQKIHECEGTMSLEGVKPSLSLLVEA